MKNKINEIEKVYFDLIELEIKTIAGDDLGKRISLEQSDEYLEELDNFFDNKAIKLNIEGYSSRKEVLDKMNNFDIKEYIEYLKECSYDRMLNLGIDEKEIDDTLKNFEL